MRIRITVKYSFRLTSMLFQVFHCFFICLEDTCLGSGFYCHVAKCDTITDAQCLCTFSCELHHLIVTSVRTNLTDNCQDQVSCINTFRKFSDQIEFHGFRNKYPGLSCHHSIKEVCTSDTCTERSECSVRTSMAVSSEDQFSRTDIVLHHNLMADTLSFPEVNPVLFCKISHFLLRCRCLRTV